MRFIGRLETTGGPVCITTPELARQWDGTDGDYWDLIEEFGAQPIGLFVNKSGVRALFFGTESGDFSVFAERRAFAVVETVYAPDGFDLATSEIDFRAHISQPNLLKLANFGGRTLLFDATLSGSEIALNRPGCAATMPSLNPAYQVPDTALIEVEPGAWSVSLFDLTRADLHVWGALFEWIGPDEGGRSGRE